MSESENLTPEQKKEAAKAAAEQKKADAEAKKVADAEKKAAAKALKEASKEITMVTVVYHKSNVVSFQLDAAQPLFRLMPGTNHIPSDIFELMKKDSILNGKIESGLIDVVSEGSEGTNPAEIYESMKPKNKRDIISNEVNAENLNAYAEIEKNAELLKLIEERLKIVGVETQYRS